MADLKELKINGVNLYDLIFPIGTVYETKDSGFNPNEKFGGTWSRIKGRVLVGVDENDSTFASSGLTGGRKTIENGLFALIGAVNGNPALIGYNACDPQSTRPALGYTYATGGWCQDGNYGYWHLNSSQITSINHSTRVVEGGGKLLLQSYNLITLYTSGKEPLNKFLNKLLFNESFPLLLLK